jgi:hypothetical protein
MTTRRRFVLSLLPAAALGAAAPPAAGQAARLEESDPQAVALGYKHDATKVDAKKHPRYAAGQLCSNCQLFQAKGSEEWAGCSAFAGRLVNAKGWCSAWVKKAA